MLWTMWDRVISSRNSKQGKKCLKIYKFMHSTNANCIPPPKLLKQRWFWHGQIILSKDVVILKTIGLFLAVNRILVMYVQKEIAIIHWYLLPLFIELQEKLWTIHHSVQSLSFDKEWFYREQFDYIHIHHNDFIFISVLVMGMKTQYICLTKSEFICYDNEYDMNYSTCTDDVYTLIQLTFLQHVFISPGWLPMLFYFSLCIKDLCTL